MTKHERIWLEPVEQSDPFIGRSWCQDNQWGDEGVEYVLASTLESLQRQVAQNAELDLTFEAEANQMREVSIANRHRAQEAEAEVKRLRAVVERAQLIVSTSTYPNWHETARTALASTGGEHHGN
ncbi:hypothetical protein [Agrobacterium tumefaciens]|uniref:hypothetical protein n=1 Tax=Agrobacterium tumefaciens TaxID=358 RepID=UPI001CC0A7FE|nr:hypothetical protein [Agrobacterium tumefaciens]